MLDEIRDEAIESAISKIMAVRQTQQLEAAEEEEEEEESKLDSAHQFVAIT